MQPVVDKINEFEQPKPMKHRKIKKSNDDKKTLTQRVIELEGLHPELKPRKPTPIYMVIGKWLLCIIIIGLFLYGIYLFYCYAQLGKDITIPFWGIVRH